MKQVTIYTTDKEYNHFLELAKNLSYVKKIQPHTANEVVLNNIKAGLKEVNLYKKGKLKTTAAKDFLHDV
jgi:hypothetical protein